MKTFAKILAVSVVMSVAYSASAADQDEKKLPPGLQKKEGKLPPGQAKKHGAGEEQVRTVTNTVYVTNTVTVAPAPAPSLPGSPKAQEAKPQPAPTVPVAKVPVPATSAPAVVKVDKDDFEKRLKSVNNLADKEAPRRAGLDAISKETGVPLAKLQSQRRENDNLGLAGLTIANVIAGKTGKPAGTYIRQRENGKAWDKIASENGVSLEELDAKIARVEAAMRATTK
jgi:hypothetical protein